MSILDFMPETKVAKIDLGFGTEKLLEVEFYPAAITASAFDSAPDTDDEAGEEPTIIDRFRDCVIRWDAKGPLPLRDEPGHAAGSVVPEGEIIPITDEALRSVPMPFLVTVWNKLAGAALPDPKGTAKQSRRHG